MYASMYRSQVSISVPSRSKRTQRVSHDRPRRRRQQWPVAGCQSPEVRAQPRDERPQAGLRLCAEVEALSYPPDCPFKTHRVSLARRRLLSFGLLGLPGREEVPTPPASRAALERLHTGHYLDELERAAAGDLTPEGLHVGLGTPDTPVFRDLFTYGAWACGAALTAAELLAAGKADIAFSLLGGFHHAMPSGGRVLLPQRRRPGLPAPRRVGSPRAVPGRGRASRRRRQAAFYRRRDVMTISLHESGPNALSVGRVRGRDWRRGGARFQRQRLAAGRHLRRGFPGGPSTRPPYL